MRIYMLWVWPSNVSEEDGREFGCSSVTEMLPHLQVGNIASFMFIVTNVNPFLDSKHLFNPPLLLSFLKSFLQHGPNLEIIFLTLPIDM